MTNIPASIVPSPALVGRALPAFPSDRSRKRKLADGNAAIAGKAHSASVMRPTACGEHGRTACGEHGRTARGGFTLIEMLTVIGIIVILMAILLPVISKVRQQVRVAHTQMQMNQIAGAIDQYFMEFNHTYPGPFSNTQITAGANVTSTSGWSGNITSTENMVIALGGGLEINAAGAITYNSNDLQSGLGPLNLTPIAAKQTRHVAFLDAMPGQRMANLPWDNGNGKINPLPPPLDKVVDSYIPEFTDKFNAAAGPTGEGGWPRAILYLRARVGNPLNGGTAAAPKICNSDDTTAQYNWAHLRAYANASDFYSFTPAIGGGGGTTDATQGGNNSNVASYYPKPTAVNGVTPSTKWDLYLGNPNLLTSPRGAGAYILISAGPDGVFGTQDDLFYP